MAGTDAKRAPMRFDIAALVVALMAVVFSLAVGPRLRGAERGQAQLVKKMEDLGQEMTALRLEMAQLRQGVQSGQASATPGTAPGGIEVTNAEGAAVLLSPQEMQSRVAVMEARQKVLIERLNNLVRDIKSSNVDLGIRDPGR